MADSFVFYRSFYKALSHLDAPAYKETMEAICNYALDGVIPNCAGVSAMAFELIKPQIDANVRRRENGKKGGRPIKEKPNYNLNETKQKPNHNLNITEPEPNVNVNVNVNDNANVNDNVNVNANDNNNIINKGKSKKQTVERDVYFPNDERLDQAFKNFVEHRKRIKKPLSTEHAMELAINKVITLATENGVMNNDLAIQIIDQSIFEGWQGLFELKENYKQKKQSVFDKWENA